MASPLIVGMECCFGLSILFTLLDKVENVIGANKMAKKLIFELRTETRQINSDLPITVLDQRSLKAACFVFKG